MILLLNTGFSSDDFFIWWFMVSWGYVVVPYVVYNHGSFWNSWSMLLILTLDWPGVNVLELRVDLRPCSRERFSFAVIFTVRSSGRHGGFWCACVLWVFFFLDWNLQRIIHNKGSLFIPSWWFCAHSTNWGTSSHLAIIDLEFRSIIIYHYRASFLFLNEADKHGPATSVIPVLSPL